MKCGSHFADHSPLALTLIHSLSLSWNCQEWQRSHPQRLSPLGCQFYQLPSNWVGHRIGIRLLRYVPDASGRV